MRLTVLVLSAAAVLTCSATAAEALPTVLPTSPTPSQTTSPAPGSSTPARTSSAPTTAPSGPTTAQPRPSTSPTATSARPSPSRSTSSPRTSTSQSTSRSATKSASRSSSSTTSPAAPTVDPIDLQAGAKAQAAKNRADHHVATLLDKIKTAALAIRAKSADAAMAEQRYTAQLTVEADARSTADTAAQRVSQARASYQRDQRNLAAAAAAAYETSAGPDGLGVSTLGTLLIAQDPSAVMDTDTENRMLVAHQVALVGQVERALGVLTAARRHHAHAVAAVARETSRLASLRSEAQAALAAARSAGRVLTAQLAKAKVSQKVADAALSSFLGGWSSADPKRADALNRAYAGLALKHSKDKPAPAGPHWTAAMGRTVVERALQYLGTDYAWAGGDADGPTRGVCAAGDAHLDCRYVGFDCSGLALYSWAPYLAMAHYAATQYTSGRFHPSPEKLLPGDLVFWSSDGTPAGIHHVALYVGDGNVVQAPESGDIVRITPLGAVSSDYFGATRPLT